MSIKLSQLPNVSNLIDTDLIEVSHDLGSNSYTSSNATLKQVAEFVSLYESLTGIISGSLFSGSPLTYQVNFSSPNLNTLYGVVITGENLRIWTISEKTTSSFVVSSNSNVPFSGYVYWRIN